MCQNDTWDKFANGEPCKLQSPSSVLASDVVRVFHGLAVVSLLLQKQSPEICEILDIGTIKI